MSDGSDPRNARARQERQNDAANQPGVSAGPLGGQARGQGTAQQRAQMAEMLRQALSAMGAGGANNSALTPEALMELARRAGISNPAQVPGLQRMMGENAQSALPQVPKHIIFQLGGVADDDFAPIICALPSEATHGLERITEITPVPNTVDWVLGIVQALAMIVSVVDLRRFLGQPSYGVTPFSRLVIVSRNDMTIGFLVDSVLVMRPLDPPVDQAQASALMAQSVPAWLQPYVAGMTLVEGRAVALLDPDALLFNERIHRYCVKERVSV
jgi:purine-binding chemotaxis protein CheW